MVLGIRQVMTDSNPNNPRAAVLRVLNLGIGLSASEVARRAGVFIAVAIQQLKALVKDGAARSAHAGRVVTYTLA